MATKTATLYARLEPETKERAEYILAELGITASNAINMFYRQIILQGGLPFEVKLPVEQPIDVSTLSKEEFMSELEKGCEDIRSGNMGPASEVFADMEHEYNL